jgi:hypothetical protein
LKGQIGNNTVGSLWIGTQAVGSSTFPDPDATYLGAFFRIQQPALLSGISASVALLPTPAHTLTLTVKYVPISAPTTQVTTPFTVTLTGTTLNTTFYNASVRLNTGDKLQLLLTYTGGNANLSSMHDLSCQLDLF